MIKTIYILWFQGFDNAPLIVRNCIYSWKYYNPDYTINLIDNENLINYINLKDYIDITNKNIPKCEISNIIRCILLYKYGGIWCDATLFCNKPLNEWLSNYINEGFFAFSKPGHDRLLSNWFLYSNKNNYIIEEWCKLTIYFHTNNTNNNYPYFIHHYLFNNLYNSDNKFKKIWNNVPVLLANGIGPHYLQEKGMFENITEEIKKDINSKITPFYKLTYKCEFPEYNETKILYYLYSTIKPSYYRKNI